MNDDEKREPIEASPDSFRELYGITTDVPQPMTLRDKLADWAERAILAIAGVDE